MNKPIYFYCGVNYARQRAFLNREGEIIHLTTKEKSRFEIEKYIKTPTQTFQQKSKEKNEHKFNPRRGRKNL